MRCKYPNCIRIRGNHINKSISWRDYQLCPEHLYIVHPEIYKNSAEKAKKNGWMGSYGLRRGLITI